MNAPTTTVDHTASRSVIPTWKEVRDGAADTRLLLKLRWRFVRTNRSKVAIWLGLGVFFLCLFTASQVGTLIRHYAEQGVATAAGTFAVNYVIALNRGELGAIGATAVGSVIIVALFTPFTGTAMQSLAPTEDLAGLRPNRLHRYFDSVVTNAVSAIGFLQLITLTGIGSLLTLDGGRAKGLLFIWSVWPALLLLSVATGWAIELTARTYGPRARYAIAAGLASVIGLAVLFDSNHGKTLFGVGDQIAHTLEAAANGDLPVVLRNFAVVVAISLVLFVAGLLLCRAAQAKPAVVTVRRHDQRRALPMSTRPNLVLTQVLVAQVLRTPAVRRPLLTIFFIGVPAVWFSTQANVMTTLVVAVPLAVALAFGVNFFGILGSAMPWLASQPHVMARLLRIAVAMQIATTLLISVLVWTPSLIAGRLHFADLTAVAAGTLISTVFTARSAAHKSVNRPYRVRLSGRGDVLVPPLTAINYTLRFALWSGQLGVVVMALHGLQQLSVVAFGLTWCALRFRQLFRQWSDRDVQAYVVKQVSAA